MSEFLALNILDRSAAADGTPGISEFPLLETPRDIVAVLGTQEQVGRMLKLSRQSISHAVAQGKFSGSAFDAIETALIMRGYRVSRDAFKWLSLFDPLFPNGQPVEQTGGHPQEVPPVFAGGDSASSETPAQ